MIESGPALECRGVSVAYGATRVLDGLDLEVDGGETVALLGPSGSGKTSLLGAIAGFIPLSAGEIHIAGAPVGPGVPPERRPVSMVFQNYALWPHLTALETVAYPLRRAGRPMAEATAEAARLLDRVGIGELAGRHPSELSGGQQQRVGLARALARSPALYLFDEPTAHLDAAMRSVLQEELIDRRREAGAGALYASHDPQEALAVADRVALLRHGRIIQHGPPRDVYESPIDAWAAHLTGPATVVQAPVSNGREGWVTVRVGEAEVTVPAGSPVAEGVATLVVRPEWARLGGPLAGELHRVRYSGSRTMALLDTVLGRVWIEIPAGTALRPGERVEWSLTRVRVLRPGTGEAG